MCKVCQKKTWEEEEEEESMFLFTKRERNFQNKRQVRQPHSTHEKNSREGTRRDEWESEIEMHRVWQIVEESKGEERRYMRKINRYARF